MEVRKMRLRRLLLPLVLVPLLALPPLTIAEERQPGWYDTAELSLVVTSGNSEGSALGFKNLAERIWPEAALTIKAGAVRVESTTFTRFATGTPSSFVVVENETSELTAEQYFLNGRYDHELSERLLAYGGLGWDRNRPSGIANRYGAEAGLGHTWISQETASWKTFYGLTLTKQEDVFEVPGADDTFLGARLGSDYKRKIGAADYANLLTVDVNGEETDDWRADMTNSLAVSFTDRLALKASLQWLYDHQPAFAAVPLLDGLGADTGARVPFELDDLDTVFTTSLVVKF
jgi:putative salt-induced outer membrane protein YdiY